MEMTESSRYEIRTTKKAVLYSDGSPPEYSGRVTVEWYEDEGCYGGHAVHHVDSGSFGNWEELEKALDTLQSDLRRLCDELVDHAREMRAKGFSVELLAGPEEDC